MARRSSPLPVYRGRFGKIQAERLLWRAGFGPRPGEAERLSRLGMKRAVRLMMKPRRTRLSGPAPKIEGVGKLTPNDQWGHDHLWWFDRMIRSTNPLQERMTLIWHDWFATAESGVGSQRMTVDQNQLFRRRATGSFRTLLKDVTHDPAMLVWLGNNRSVVGQPNENYARELMELFTLGAGARYTERDVREQARALTGWTNDWGDAGYENFRFDLELHDRSEKQIFGKTGNFDWEDSCDLCVEHPDHPTFFVRKLWSYFIPTPVQGRTLSALKRLYMRSNYSIGPVVQAILMHPNFYQGPRMVKPPIVYSAGLLRMRRTGITSDSWAWLSGMTGQRLFDPPNVSGWNDEMWLDTGTFRARWIAAREVWDRFALDPGSKKNLRAYRDEKASEAVRRAVAFWGDPTLSSKTLKQLIGFSRRCDRLADREWKTEPYRVMRQNALRMMIAASPDLNTC